MLLTIPLLNQVSRINGWLEIEEADLLMSCLLKICTTLAPPHTVVEIGSYQGKSTVLLGSILQSYSPASKLYAIDPHQGVIGAEGQNIQKLQPSFEAFKWNIIRAGLSNIEIIKDYSFNINWNSPICLLFIDGLHDYENVSRDFNHFSSHIVQGGFVAFHDYGDFFPGVKSFVNEILNVGKFRTITSEKSLIVLQKTIE